MKISEKQLTIAIAQYLQAKKILYRFELSADLKLTIGQAVRNKKIHPYRGYPDLLILEQKNGYGGLFVELKKEHSEVFKKNGEFKKNIHIEEQIAYHKLLREKGYMVVWGFGYKDTINKIQEYLK